MNRQRRRESSDRIRAMSAFNVELAAFTNSVQECRDCVGSDALKYI